MRIVVFSCFDVAAGVYGRPQFYASKGLAIRAFTDEVNRQAEDNALQKHPADFQLFHVGYFDDVEGVFEPMKPERVVTASEVKQV